MTRTVSTNCVYSDPVRYDGSTPTLPTHHFYFKNSVCTESDNATSTILSNVGYNPTTTISSTTDIAIYGSMSAGEILIALFLFILIWIKLLSFIPAALDRVKTKRKFLGYNGGDVEVRDDI